MNAALVTTEQTAGSAVSAAAASGGGAGKPAQQAKSSSSSKGMTTTIHHADGTTEVRHGSAAYRNNNPGNIRPGPFANTHGTIGTDPAPKPGYGPWAVFDSTADGDKALDDLLHTSSVQNRTISDEMKLYAKAGDGANDPKAYADHISGAVGAPADTVISKLTPEQMSNFKAEIKKQEGYFGTSKLEGK